MTPLFILSIIVVGLAILTICIFAWLYWIALGESDVNGDPERDAGKQAVVCSWCQEVMQPGFEPVTHGICDRCADKLRRESQSILLHQPNA